nr:putative late blight resistance protein homolog R1B-8 [Ipomoea trifida]GLL32159.1 putative late blight resistance protein homolog R1B-8 [Ipomoea trifida]
MTIVLDKVVEDVASKVVNKFVQTIAANMELVSGIGSAIAELTSDIETFNARLVDASKNQDASELQVLRVAVKKFRSVVDEAQDAVAKYIALNKKHEDTYFAKYLDKIPYPFWGNITVQAKEIQSISIKMNKLLQTHEKDLISYMTYKSIMGHDPNMQPLQLLEKKIFGGERCPTSLEDFGKSIAMKCNGVPIVVEKISKVLRENMTLADWRRIESNPLASIGYDDPTMK